MAENTANLKAVVTTAVKQHVFSTLGIDLDTEIARQVPLNSEWGNLGMYSINPRMCGPVAAMFKSINVSISAGVSTHNGKRDGQYRLHIVYQYSYSHPDGGSNGKRVEETVDLTYRE